MRLRRRKSRHYTPQREPHLPAALPAVIELRLQELAEGSHVPGPGLPLPVFLERCGRLFFFTAHFGEGEGEFFVRPVDGLNLHLHGLAFLERLPEMADPLACSELRNMDESVHARPKV